MVRSATNATRLSGQQKRSPCDGDPLRYDTQQQVRECRKLLICRLSASTLDPTKGLSECR